MEVAGIKCKKCGTYVYSRARHDFRMCPCETCGVDGGQGNDYMRIIGNKDDYEFEKRGIPYINDELIADYRAGANKLGYIVSEANESN